MYKKTAQLKNVRKICESLRYASMGKFGVCTNLYHLFIKIILKSNFPSAGGLFKNDLRTKGLKRNLNS